MKRAILFFLIIVSPVVLFAQVAPQIGFADKLSISEQKNAKIWTKAPLVFNGSNYDLKYHRMKWNIDPDTLFISGEVTSYFKTTQSNVIQISFDMSSVLNIDSIIYHSVNLSYSLMAFDALIIYLPAALPYNQLDSVSVFYHGVPPQGTGFGSFRKDTHDTIPIIWTLSEPFGAKEWWPCKNDLSDKIDSIDVYVTTPALYKVSSNGLLISETINGQYQTAHWKHNYPITAYLIAVAVTNYQSFSIYAHYETDSIEVLNYVYPETFASTQTNILPVIQSLELYDSLFILYPFADERYGHTQFNWAGGMEHQTNTFLFYFQHEIMAHELAHQWVGDMITCGNWHEIWLNEGFATYWTGLTYNYLFNGYYWPFWKRMQIDNIVSLPDGSVYCPDTTSISRIFDGRLSYQKGAMLLHMLRWVIGDSAFYAGMKNYLTDTNLAYSYACSDDFITHVETVSDTSLTEFFNDWLYGEGYPVYSVNCVFSGSNNDLQVIINQTQSHLSVSYFEMPVPLEFKDSTHDTIVVFHNSFSGQQYSVNVGFKPDSVKFDPKMWLVAVLDTIILNVSEYPHQETISVFPNPANDHILIDFSSGNFTSAEIYNSKGMLVKSFIPDVAAGKISINVSGLSSGVYYLKTVAEKEFYIRKIVKM